LRIQHAFPESGDLIILTAAVTLVTVDAGGLPSCGARSESICDPP